MKAWLFLEDSCPKNSDRKTHEMADVAETGTFTEPGIAISQGRRHLLVRDYTMAVSALAQACQLLAEKHGDTADQLGEPYLLYGRALLGLAREEAGVLGERVPPGSEEPEEDDEDDEEDEEDDDEEDDEDDDEEEEKLSTVDEKGGKEEKEGPMGEAGKGGKGKEKREEEAKSSEQAAEKTGQKEESSSAEKNVSAKRETKEEEPRKAVREKSSEQQSPGGKGRKSEKPEQPDGETESGQSPEQNGQQTVEPSENENRGERDKVVPGSSKEANHSNGPSPGPTGQKGGGVKEGVNDDSEDIEKDEEEEDEEVNNLQVAWEVLELAKLVLTKRGKTGWKLLADAHRLLGEVAMEGGNHVGALNDLHGCLDLLQKVEPRDARAIAEIHYQLALAHSLGNDFDQSIAEFNKATALLESRIKELEEMKDPPKAEDTFYTVEGEIQELKELLPEIQEKITDMKDFKQEACRLVIEGIKSKVAGGCSNGAGPSSAAPADASSTPSKLQKPTSDISHLVRKKRKAEDTETDVVASPCKKPTPEKAV